MEENLSTKSKLKYIICLVNLYNNIEKNCYLQINKEFFFYYIKNCLEKFIIENNKKIENNYLISFLYIDIKLNIYLKYFLFNDNFIFNIENKFCHLKNEDKEINYLNIYIKKSNKLISFLFELHKKKDDFNYLFEKIDNNNNKLKKIDKIIDKIFVYIMDENIIDKKFFLKNLKTSCHFCKNDKKYFLKD